MEKDEDGWRMENEDYGAGGRARVGFLISGIGLAGSIIANSRMFYRPLRQRLLPQGGGLSGGREQPNLASTLALGHYSAKP